MAFTTYVFIIAIVAGAGRAQLANVLVPALENIVGRVFNTFTAVPRVAARFSRQSFPNLITENDLREVDNIIPDFNLGTTNEDATMPVGKLIVKYGYPMEKHKVRTEDGYMLKMFRIPSNGSVVFLMHGLLGSADDFVVAGSQSGLAYHLSKEGYDVWMGNARGNKHSRRHVKYNTSEAIFWDFSWHEIGCYDLPAMIDYVLNTTKQETVKYVGHSQGTTAFFVMASEKPEYNKKISLMVALSPVAYMKHVTSPVIRLLVQNAEAIYGFLAPLGFHEFLPENSIMRMLKSMMCGTGRAAEMMCSNALFLIVGFGFAQLNATNLPVIYGHIPSGASAKQLLHYSQGVKSGEFRQFDHGAIENIRRYGSEHPPKYKLKNIVAPVTLFYSDDDWLSNSIDVDKLYNKLNNVIDIHKVPVENFNHLDFIWAKDFNTLIYDRIRKLFKHF